MSIHHHKLRDAIVLALSSSVFVSTAALAQDAPSQENKTEELDRIEVTGTRIRQVDIETAAPVLTISRAEIEKQGFQSVSDILQNISAMGAPPLTRAQPLSAGEVAGGTFISLRNLGAVRTLVLLNGRRLGVTTSGLADTSTIPAIAVERIEVLKDGASAIYGSDAIGGVVNIITRTNYTGASGSVYFGQYSEGDGNVTNGDFAIGISGERGSLAIGAEWGEEEKVAASDRDYSAFPRSGLHPTDGWTTVHAGGGYVRSGTRVVLRPGGDSRNPADFVPQNTVTGTCVGATVASGCTPGSTLNKSNTNEQTDLRIPLERRGLFIDGVYDINDRLRFRTNLLYSNRVTDRQVAGYPFQAAQFNTPLSGTSYFNPTPGTAIGNWWRRTWEVPRVSTSDLTTYRFVGALEGSFDIGERGFDWDVSYLRNNNKLEQSSVGNLNLANVRAAVGPSFLNAQGRVQCGTAAAAIAFSACVPWNPFLPFGRAGQGGLTDNPELHNFLFQEEHAVGETTTTVVAANLSGSLFTLPAGDLGFAVGYEHRKEEGRFIPDALSVTGGSTNLAAGPTRGEYKVDEIYAELQVPILADMAFAKELRLDVATRFSDYDTFGKTTNNKFGLKWKPIDSLLVRATYADGFRAPTINDLYGGGSQTFANFSDPCDTFLGGSTTGSPLRANCTNGVGGNGALGGLAATFRQLGQGFLPVGVQPSQTPVPFNTGSNPNLNPETSDSRTLGVAWNPGFAPGLYLSLDWWKIRIDDTIVADTPNQILSDCYVQGIAARCSPQLFTRDPTQGFVNFMLIAGINAGYREVEGFDFDVSYRLKTENWGEFRVMSNTTYTASDVFVNTNDRRNPFSVVGQFSTINSTNSFRVRSNLNLGWQKGAFGVSLNSRYYSSMKEPCTYLSTVAGVPQVGLECNDVEWRPTGVPLDRTGASRLTPFRRVGSNTFHDLQVRWTAPWDAVIAVGANNVFGHEGPVMYSQPNANVSYFGGFDIGRFWYVKYTQKF